MALSVAQTAALAQILKPGMSVASMGYPDLIAPHDMFEKMLNHDLVSLNYREDSDDICRRHGLQQTKIPDAESFFKCMGCKLDVYDIVKERGCEILCDLNVPMVSRETYNIVLDVGTVEHCFNVAQAMMNMAMMVKSGGYIIHENPFNWPNHGFYNLNPTWYHDFYAANGFKMLNCSLVTRSGEMAEIPHTARFRAPKEEFNVFAIAQRITVQPFVFPVQTKYAKLIPAAGERASLPEGA